MKNKKNTLRGELAGITHAFSVHPQWAYLIFHPDKKKGKKDVENRSRPTNFRKRVAVHACKTLTRQDKERAEQYNIPLEKLQPGKIIGTVEIYGCVQSSKSKWAETGYYHWLLTRPRALKLPRAMRGSQNMYPIKGRLL